jgi:hypothetical protein
MPSPPGGVTPDVGPLETEQVVQTPAAPAGKTVSAGMQTDFYSPYTIRVAPGWGATHVSNPAGPLDMLTLAKGDYSLLVTQGGGDSALCIFGGAPTPIGEAHFWTEFPGGVEIAGGYAPFMRATIDGLTHFVCEKKGEEFSQLTSFGYITYTTPNPADPAILAEMDGMVASLTN